MSSQIKFITRNLLIKFNKYKNQRNVKNPIIIAKYTNPLGNENWFAIEYNETNKTFYGYVEHEKTWREFTLSELREFKGEYGLGLTRDLLFVVRTTSETIPEALVCKDSSPHKTLQCENNKILYDKKEITPQIAEMLINLWNKFYDFVDKNENTKAYLVKTICKEDLLDCLKLEEIKHITEGDMETIADKLGEALNDDYWISLDIIVKSIIDEKPICKKCKKFYTPKDKYTCSNCGAKNKS